MLVSLTILRNSSPYTIMYAKENLNGVQKVRQVMINLFDLAHGISGDLSDDDPIDICFFLTTIHQITDELTKFLTM